MKTPRRQIQIVEHIARRALVLMAFALSITALASTSGITYHGRVVKPDGTPLESLNVQFKLQIRTPNASNCLLYEETKTLNMKSTSGIFDLTLNDGTGSRTDSTGLALDIIFANRGSLAGNNCTIGPGTYSPDPNDGRRFQVSFKDENMTAWEPLPAQNLNFIPLAIEAKQVGGFTAANLFRVEDASGPSPATSFTTLQFNELFALSNGSSTNYLRTSSNSAYVPTRAGAPATPVAGQFWFDTGSSQLKYYDGATTQTLASGGSLPALPNGQMWMGNVSNAATAVTASGDATISAAGVVALKATGTAGSYFKVTTDAQGRVTNGVAALAEADIPTLSAAGKVNGSAITGTINTTGTVTAASFSSTTDSTHFLWLNEPTNTNKIIVSAPASLAVDYTLTLPPTAGTSGYVLSTNGSGVLSWVAASGGSVTSVTGAAPVTVGGAAAAPVVSMAQATGSVPGYLSAADFTTFNGKLSGSLADGKIYVGNTGTASAVTPAGDATMTNAGVITVGKLQGRAVASTTPVTSQVLRYNTATTTWETQYLNITDLKKTDGTTQFQSASCGAGQTLNWSALTDLFTCTTISIPSSQVTGLGTAAALNVGTALNNVVQLDGSAKMPAVDGGALTNLNASNISAGTLDVARGGTGTASGSITGTGALAFAAGGTNQNISLTPSGTGVTMITGSVALSGDGAVPTSQLTIGNSNHNQTRQSLQILENGYGDPTADQTYSVGDKYIQWNEYGIKNAMGNDAYGIWTQASGGASAHIGFWTGPTAGVAPLERMRVDSAGNVGIGATNPKSKLDVNGSVRVGADTTSCSATIQGAIHMNGTALEYCDGSSWLALSTATGSYLSLSGGTLSGGLSISSGGASITGGINANNGAISNAGAISGNGTVMMSPTSAVTSGSNSVNGFLATYNPASAPAVSTSVFGVSNQVTTAGALSLTNAAVAGAQNSAVHGVTSTLGVAEGALNQVTNFTSGTITNAYGSVNRVNNAASGTVTSAYGAFADVLNPTGTLTNGYGFYAGQIAGTNKFSFYASDATAPNYFAGKVGVGTTSPLALLEVQGALLGSSTIPAVRVLNTSTTQGDGLTTFNEAVMRVDANNSGVVGSFLALYNSAAPGPGVALTSNATNPIFLAPGGVTPSMTLLNGGNVGIGTTAPSATFHLVGTSLQTSPDCCAPIRTLNADYVTYSSAEVITANGLAGGNILSLTSTTPNAFGAGTAGLNVAISGNNTPSGATKTGVTSAVSGSGTNSTNVGGSFSASGATNNYGLLVPNGNVGIGVATPSDALAVAGSGYFNAKTTLTAGSFVTSVNSSATTIPVNNTSGYASSGVIWIDSEAVRYTGTTGSSFTGATRGVNGTTAAGHSGTLVKFADLTVLSQNQHAFSVLSDGSIQSYNSMAQGLNSTALGYGNSSTGTNTTTLGTANIASGYGAIAIGASTTSSGSSSISLGSSIAASGDASLALGNNITAAANAQVTVGQFNAPKGSENASGWVLTDPLFVVGNGISSGAKSNAMMILKNGNVGLGTTTPNATLEVNGHIGSTASGAPTSSCGTISGSDTRGTVSSGSALTTCTLTFKTAYGSAPFCVVSPITAGATAAVTAVSATAMTVTNTNSSLGFTYICMQ